LSAKTPEALTAQAERLAEHLTPDSNPLDIAYALATTRATFQHRAVITGNDLDTLRTGLTTPTVQDTAEPTGKTVFVFPGQGSQWEGMATELLTTSTPFAESIARSADALAPYIDWSLTDVLRGEPHAPGLDRVDVVQPALWAVMIALTDTWHAMGIHPDAVIGHSQGEIAAACVAGILTPDDGARIVALRSQIIAQHLAGKGAMASISLPADTLHTHLTHHPTLEIAALNGPTTTVIAGPHHDLENLLTTLENNGTHLRRIPVDYASHTTAVETIKTQLHQALTPITPHPGHTTFYSTVTATPLNGTDLTPDYWYQNLRNTVRFHPTIQTLLTHGHTTYIEPSPHPVLTAPIQETSDTAHVQGTLRRHDGTHTRLLTAAAQAWTHGLPITWTTHLPNPHTTTHTPLPTYPFQHHHYWL
ncbi:acyltransferase domain-containing protein, partial [Streptomyces sp. NPDC090029]|uniref:acyltransferase domain-containing protein n=1 Tax=Streptomyces sp. NPDC090029 TaxID=3365924 RepID=UPI0038296EB7